jgi:hypothetical protein
VNVANVEAVERRAIGTRSSATFRWASSAVLLGLGELRNYGNTLQFLTSQFESFGNRLFIFELNVADTGAKLVQLLSEGSKSHTLWSDQ